MTALEWDYQYSIGVRELDNQHKQLISLLNQSYNELIAGSSTGDRDLMLVELMDYAAFHLKYEAKWLEKSEHIFLRKHQKSTENLRNKVIRIQNYYFRSGKLDSDRILSFMKRWIANHITEAKVSFSGSVASQEVEELQMAAYGEAC
jgi:hemerythrin